MLVRPRNKKPRAIGPGLAACSSAVARMERSEIRDGGSARERPRIALRSIRATNCDVSTPSQQKAPGHWPGACRLQQRRSPDAAKRNPGRRFGARETPDCAALHPGYEL